MKRSGFSSQPRRPETQSTYTPRPRERVNSRTDASATLVVPRPKQVYVRDESYRRWVASLPCAHCGIEGYSQAAHSDDNGAGGKGMGIKACDSTLYPACGPRPGEPGCHWLIGTGGILNKAERKALEAAYARDTRDAWHFAQQG